jgi:hypothetical protein
MQAPALLSHLFNDRKKGLRKLFALFRPHLYFDEYDNQLNFLSLSSVGLGINKAIVRIGFKIPSPR